MATAMATRMTVEEFERLPDPTSGFRLELQNGEIKELPPVKYLHLKIQKRILVLLDARLLSQGFAATEFPFMPVSEHEWRFADVAYVSKQRDRLTSPDGCLQGAPDLTVEVLSPSDTVREMLSKEQLCLQNGGLEFWIVDPELRTVHVRSTAGPTREYRLGGAIPLTAFGGEPIAVDDIFIEN